MPDPFTCAKIDLNDSLPVQYSFELMDTCKDAKPGAKLDILDLNPETRDFLFEQLKGYAEGKVNPAFQGSLFSIPVDTALKYLGKVPGFKRLGEIKIPGNLNLAVWPNDDKDPTKGFSAAALVFTLRPKK